MSENEIERAFLLDPSGREELWRETLEAIEKYLVDIRELPVKRRQDVASIRKSLETFTFDQPKRPAEVVRFFVEGMREHQTHFSHPAYFGLFDPGGTPLGAAADALTAAFNPQLAANMQSLLPIEAERFLLRKFGAKFGYDPDGMEGTFTSGGSEANHTAMLAALSWKFPDFRPKGLRALPAQPVVYVSREAHHSIHKAARLCGLGDRAVREVDVDDKLRMSGEDLRRQIAEDKRNGLAPFFVAATAGTTKAGTVDGLAEIGGIAGSEGLWFHVDGAWGGAVCLSAKHRHVIDGIEAADSITLDAHKWLVVPMGAGMYLSRHPGLLRETFSRTTGYIATQEWDVVEPYQASMATSRRFTGLKLFLTLATVGWRGYEQMIDAQVALGDYLRDSLRRDGWKILNDTVLPVVCFTDEKRDPQELAKQIVESGKAWISPVQLSVPGENTRPALRAAVVNFRSTTSDIDDLLKVLSST